MSNGVNTVLVPLSALNPLVDGTAIFAFKAPAAAVGGGITITEVWVTNNAATGSGTAFAISLQKFSSAGTPVLNGTICAAIGGTGDVFAAGVPKVGTVTAGFVSAGEWVAINYDTTAGGTPTAGVLGFNYKMGRAAQ